jgi:signal transduction histidine kinase
VSRPKLTVRMRLTLLYTCVFAAGGAILTAITYALVAALPITGNATTIQFPGGRDTSEVMVPDRQSFEPICQQALAAATVDERLREKCVIAYQIWSARSQRDAMLAHLLHYSLATLAIVVALAALGGWLLAGRTLRPVHRITAAARAASQRNLSARVALAGPRDEMRELADTFDAMLARLQTAFDSQERFIANASHELRTPLTVMRASVDVALAKPAATPDELRRMARDVRAAVDDAEELIEALLTLARNERGLAVREEVDLATAAEDALDTVDTRDRRVHTALEPALATGDPVLLERLVVNLVENAVRYNEPAGQVWVSTSTVEGRATVTVANTGPAVAPGAVADLFKPFHRLQDRTTADGFGLGLAIVASIAAMHDAGLAARPRPEGGLEVRLTMPATDPAHAPVPGPAHGPARPAAASPATA